MRLDAVRQSDIIPDIIEINQQLNKKKGNQYLIL